MKTTVPSLGLFLLYSCWNIVNHKAEHTVKNRMCGANQTRYKVHCYWISLREKSWNEAATFCKRKGGILSDLVEREDLEFFGAFLMSSSVYSAWVYVSRGEKGTASSFYCWINKTTIKIIPVALCCSYNTTWGDFVSSNCTDKKQFACKFPILEGSVRLATAGQQLIRHIRNSQDDDEYEQDVKPPREYPLLIFRVIACSMLIILVGITIIIFITTRMFYNDCVAHLSCEIALFSAFICILITTCESYYISRSMCLGVSIMLQYFFLVVFLCQMLEMVIIARMLLSWFPKQLFISNLPMLLLGWGLPAVITILTVVVAHDQYVSDTDCCWIDITKGIKWSSIIPIGIFVGVHTVLVLMVLLVREIPSKVRPEDIKRARTALSSRWASGIVVIFLTLVWSTGLMATYRNNEAFYGIFCVNTIILGAMIFILRLSTEEEVRKRITLAFTSDPVTVVQENHWRTNSLDSDNSSLYSHVRKSPVVSTAWATRINGRK